MAKKSVVIKVTDQGLKEVLATAKELEKVLNNIGSKTVGIGGGSGAGAPGKNTSKNTKKNTKATKDSTKANKEYSDSASDVYRSNRGISGSSGKAGKDMSNMAKGMGGFVAVYATIAAKAFALSAAFELLKSAMDTSIMVKGLEHMGAASGTNLHRMAEGFREAAGGAVSLAESMRTVSFASSAGMGEKQLTQLAKVAKGAALALGRSLPDAVDRLTRGVVKLEPEILDELGLIVKLGPATEKYARALGKSVNELSAYERQQAFANETIEQGIKKFGDLADKLDSNPYDKLAANLADIVQKILGFINNTLEPAFKFFSENIEAAAALIIFAFRNVMMAINDTFNAAATKPMEAMSKAWDDLATSASKAGTKLATSGKAVKASFTGGVEGVAKAALKAETSNIKPGVFGKVTGEQMAKGTFFDEKWTKQKGQRMLSTINAVLAKSHTATKDGFVSHKGILVNINDMRHLKASVDSLNILSEKSTKKSTTAITSMWTRTWTNISFIAKTAGTAVASVFSTMKVAAASAGKVIMTAFSAALGWVGLAMMAFSMFGDKIVKWGEQLGILTAGNKALTDTFDQLKSDHDVLEKALAKYNAIQAYTLKSAADLEQQYKIMGNTLKGFKDTFTDQLVAIKKIKELGAFNDVNKVGAQLSKNLKIWQGFGDTKINGAIQAAMTSAGTTVEGLSNLAGEKGLSTLTQVFDSLNISSARVSSNLLEISSAIGESTKGAKELTKNIKEMAKSLLPKTEYDKVVNTFETFFQSLVMKLGVLNNQAAAFVENFRDNKDLQDYLEVEPDFDKLDKLSEKLGESKTNLGGLQTELNRTTKSLLAFVNKISPASDALGEGFDPMINSIKIAYKALFDSGEQSVEDSFLEQVAALEKIALANRVKELKKHAHITAQIREDILAAEAETTKANLQLVKAQEEEKNSILERMFDKRAAIYHKYATILQAAIDSIFLKDNISDMQELSKTTLVGLESAYKLGRRAAVLKSAGKKELLKELEHQQKITTEIAKGGKAYNERKFTIKKLKAELNFISGEEALINSLIKEQKDNLDIQSSNYSKISKELAAQLNIQEKIENIYLSLVPQTQQLLIERKAITELRNLEVKYASELESLENKIAVATSKKFAANREGTDASKAVSDAAEAQVKHLRAQVDLVETRLRLEKNLIEAKRVQGSIEATGLKDYQSRLKAFEKKVSGGPMVQAATDVVNITKVAPQLKALRKVAKETKALYAIEARITAEKNKHKVALKEEQQLFEKGFETQITQLKKAQAAIMAGLDAKVAELKFNAKFMAAEYNKLLKANMAKDAPLVANTSAIAGLTEAIRQNTAGNNGKAVNSSKNKSASIETVPQNSASASASSSAISSTSPAIPVAYGTVSISADLKTLETYAYSSLMLLTSIKKSMDLVVEKLGKPTTGSNIAQTPIEALSEGENKSKTASILGGQAPGDKKNLTTGLTTEEEDEYFESYLNRNQIMLDSLAMQWEAAAESVGLSQLKTFGTFVKSVDMISTTQNQLNIRKDKGLQDWDKTVGASIKSNNKQYKKGDKEYISLSKARAAHEKDIVFKQEQEKLSSYASTFGSLGSMMKEGSKAQQAFHAIEKGIHLAQMAMSVAKLLGYGEVAAASVASSTTVIGAEVSKMGPKGTNAILTQGEGDPYTAPARMAAMAALVAVVMSSVGGGKSVSTAAPKTQRVSSSATLETPEEKANSLSTALENIEEIEIKAFEQGWDVLYALRSIDDSMTKLSTDIIKGMQALGGIGTFSIGDMETVFGDWFGTTVKPAFLGLFGGKSTTTELMGAGIQIVAQKLADVIDLDAGSWANLELKVWEKIKSTTTKSGFLGFGGGTSSSTTTNWKDFDTDAENSFAKTLFDIGDAVLSLGEDLGYARSALIDNLRDFEIAVQDIDLKDLSPEEQASAVQNALSAIANDITLKMIPAVEQWRYAGEEYLEALSRVYRDMLGFKQAFDRIGLTTGDFLSATGIEDILDWQQNVLKSKKGGFGDIKGLLTSLEKFSKAIYGEGELAKFALDSAKNRVGTGLSELGLAAGTSVDDFRTWYESKLGTGFFDDPDKLATMIRLGEAFGDMTNSADDLKDAFGDIIGLIDEMKYGELSSLTDADKYGHFKTEAEKLAADAMAGNVKAGEKLAETMSSFIDLSKSMFGGVGEFMKDRDWALKMLEDFRALMGFANGGVISGGFRAFASGGIVSNPTMGLIGEGRYNEAVVPLPDGTSIPVLQNNSPMVEELKAFKEQQASLMQVSINTSSQEREEMQDAIISLKAEIVELRNSNEEFGSSVERMSTSMKYSRA